MIVIGAVSVIDEDRESKHVGWRAKRYRFTMPIVSQIWIPRYAIDPELMSRVQAHVNAGEEDDKPPASSPTTFLTASCLPAILPTSSRSANASL